MDSNGFSQIVSSFHGFTPEREQASIMTEHMEPRREELVLQLQQAADETRAQLDQDLEYRIDLLTRETARKKAAITNIVTEAREKPAADVLRKWRGQNSTHMRSFFLSNMTTGRIS